MTYHPESNLEWQKIADFKSKKLRKKTAALQGIAIFEDI